MKILLVTFYLMLVLGSSICAVIPRSTTVDLSYTCMKISTKDHKDDGIPILLLHGLSGYKEVWMGLFQVLALRTGKRVCLADLRNHGDSPWSDEFDVDTMASDLNPLLETLNAKKVVLVGHSLGGKIAVHFSLKYPDKVEKLVVEDMRPNGMTPEAMEMVVEDIKIFKTIIHRIPEGSTEKQAKLIIYEYMKEMAAKMNETIYLDETQIDNIPIKCTEGKCAWKMNIKMLDKFAEDTSSILTTSTGLYDKPTLFIYGKNSPLRVGDDEEEILKLFPRAKLVGVKDADHIVNDKPEYLDEVIKFINSKK